MEAVQLCATESLCSAKREKFDDNKADDNFKQEESKQFIEITKPQMNFFRIENLHNTQIM